MKGFSLKKKTPFQKAKEAEEEKKRRAEEEAAKVYEEFVESFKADEEAGGKAFVRGGTVQPGQSGPPQGVGGSAKRGSKYAPRFMPPGMAAALTGKEPDKDEASVFPLPASRNERNKPRAIDTMLENLKREQETRDERQRLRREGKSLFDVPPDDPLMGSFDDGDPYTTNLYVGNLAPDIDEEILKREFTRFGPVASVKIMWPRSEEEIRRARNCGFVAFMRRDDADAAKNALNGAMLHDQELKIGWGKAVPIPAFPLPNSAAAAATKFTGAPAIAQPGVAAAVAGALARLEAPAAFPVQASSSAASLPEPERPEIHVKIPDDPRLRFLIDTMACYVLRDGCSFEQCIMEREIDNPEYQFLFALESSEHAYYRWRLWSLANGDTLRSWRAEPFVMVNPGAKWVPPPMTAVDGRHQTAAQRGASNRDVELPLSDIERDKCEDLLRKITMSRTHVKEAMVFALDHAESAREVVEVISESLSLKETPLPTKIARLFLVSDILHNSTAPVRNASRYRSRLEEALPDVFESLQELYGELDSRMSQETLRRHVLRLLRVWRDWFIFSDDYLNGLQATFLRGAAGDYKPNTEMAAELSKLAPEELEHRAKRNGLSRKGEPKDIIDRFLHLDYYLHGERQPDVPAALPLKAPLKADPANIQGLEQVNGAPERGPFVIKAQGPLTIRGQGPPAGPAADGAGADTPPMPLEVLDQQLARVKRETTPEATAPPLPPLPPPEPASKWTAAEDEPGDGDDQEDGSAGNIFSDEDDPHPPVPLSTQQTTAQQISALDPPSSVAQQPQQIVAITLDPAADEERRKKLREVEVAVMVYRESLEEEETGLTKQQMEEKVVAYRERMLAKAEGTSKGTGDVAVKKDKDKGADEGERSSKSRTRPPDSAPSSSKKEGTKDKAKDTERAKEPKSSTKDESSRKDKRKRSPSKDTSTRVSDKKDKERDKKVDAKVTRSKSEDDGKQKSKGSSKGTDKGTNKSGDKATEHARSRNDDRERRRSRSPVKKSKEDRKAKPRSRSPPRKKHSRSPSTRRKRARSISSSSSSSSDSSARDTRRKHSVSPVKHKGRGGDKAKATRRRRSRS